MLVALKVPDSLGDFIQLLVQTSSLLAGWNVSFELFCYRGKTTFIYIYKERERVREREREHPNSASFSHEDRPHCHFLLSLSVYLTERTNAEELKLALSHKNTS